MNAPRTIPQVDEVTHNQAMIALAAGRRELLSQRQRVLELEQIIQQQAAMLEKANARIVELETETKKTKAAKKEPVIDLGSKGNKS